MMVSSTARILLNILTEGECLVPAKHNEDLTLFLDSASVLLLGFTVHINASKEPF
jgi:hypothetical protein